MKKQSYLSPANGMLDITVIRDSRPYTLISLDLGIPNFTVFSLKFPLVKDKPSTMSELVAEGVHVLLDEMSAFMLSTGYQQEIIVKIYAAVLTCFKGMTGEADTNKSMSPISKDPTVKVFEGTFKLPMEFINETYAKVVTAAGKNIKRPPVNRRMEFTYEKPMKTTVNDARSVIRNYRSRSLKSQPNPMYILVYDMMGNPKGTIALGGPTFKNNLLNAIYSKGKKAGQIPEFTPTVKFDNDVEMKTTNVEGIPKSVFVGDEQYTPYAFISDDMALYANEKDEWVVKFSDGRCVAFADFPSVEELKEGNYPIPTVYTNWSILSKDDIPEASDDNEAVDEQGNEVIEPSETQVNPETDLKPDDEKNEQQQDKDKTGSLQKTALNIPRLVKDFGNKLVARYHKEHHMIGQPSHTAEQIIHEISSLDTTPTKEYTPWLVSQYARGGATDPDNKDKGIKRFEDIQARAIPALKRFDALKRSKKLPNQERDITRVPGLKFLEALVDKYEEVDTTSNRQLEVSEEQKFFTNKEATLVFNDAQVKVVLPHTTAAACFFGVNTKWCTAATGSHNAFDSYNSRGHLYIVLIKAKNERYQFHFEDGQFMDEKDQPIDTWELVAQYPVLKQIFGNIAQQYEEGHTSGFAQRLAFVDNPSPEFILKAVRTDGRVLKHFPNASPEIQIAGVAKQMGFKEDTYDPQPQSFEVERWENVDAFAEDKGDSVAKWCAGVSTGDTNFDVESYDRKENMQQALDACKPETLAQVNEYLKFHNKDELIEYMAETDNEEWEQPDYATNHFPLIDLSAKEVVEFIIDKDLDDEGDKIMSGWYNGQERGAENEAVQGLKKAFQRLSDETEYGTYFTGPTDEKFWDIPVVERMSMTEALKWTAEYPDEEDVFDRVQSDYHFEFKVEQPYYGWSGWDEEVVDERIAEEFYVSDEERESKAAAAPLPLFDTPQEEVKTSSRTNEDGYWVGEGGGASGVLPICTTTGRIALAWRSHYIHNGDCWGTIGGAIQRGMSPADSAKSELAEETGYRGGIRLISAFVFIDGEFKYYNFLGLVASEFGLHPEEDGYIDVIVTNEQGERERVTKVETEAIEWFTWQELQNDMATNSGTYHPGVVKLFQQSGDQIRQICEAASNKKSEG